MIAIMILGLGMVMAATVFPVSLDMTKGTLQLNISQTAADAAAATLAIRVPRQTPLDNSGIFVERLRFPNVSYMERDAVVDPAPGEEQYYSPRDVTFSVTVTLAEHDNTRIYTEFSFWDAERFPSPLSPSFVIAAQTMQPGPTLPCVPELPPTPDGSAPSFPRVSIADRVYPPVDVVYDVNGFVLPSVREEIANRRYCWTALHYRDLRMDQTHSSFFCQIVVLYRANLNSRYIRQEFATYPINQPYPAAAPEVIEANDTLFPQAWMVAVDVDGSMGRVGCTSDVAKLLPVGSYMISVGAPDGTPGAFTKIIKNNWNGIDLLATLQIAPGSFPGGPGKRVWIFPPAIESAPASGRDMGNVKFESASPVVDVVPKKVTAG